MTTKIKMKREVSLDGELAVIDSTVKETLDQEEYERLFTKKVQDMQAMDYAMRDAKQRLEILTKAEKEVSELNADEKQVYRMMDLVLKIKELKELRDKLKEIEITFVRLQEEVKALKPTYDKFRKDG